MIISFIIAISVIILDQATKLLIFNTPEKSIIGNLLWFKSTFNTGVAFSMFSDMTILFSLLSCIASGVFIYLIISNRFLKYKAEKIILGFILGGTVGNAIDRIALGGVRDFIYLKFINFAIFNIADMAISLGAIAFCVFVIFFELKENDKQNSSKNSDNSKKEIDVKETSNKDM